MRLPDSNNALGCSAGSDTTAPFARDAVARRGELVAVPDVFHALVGRGFYITCTRAALRLALEFGVSRTALGTHVKLLPESERIVATDLQHACRDALRKCLAGRARGLHSDDEHPAAAATAAMAAGDDNDNDAATGRMVRRAGGGAVLRGETRVAEWLARGHSLDAIVALPAARRARRGSSSADGVGEEGGNGNGDAATALSSATGAANDEAWERLRCRLGARVGESGGGALFARLPFSPASVCAAALDEETATAAADDDSCTVLGLRRSRAAAAFILAYHRMRAFVPACGDELGAPGTE